MAERENKAVVQGMIEELFNKKSVDAVGGFFAEDMVVHNPPLTTNSDHELRPRTLTTKPGLEGMKEMFLSSFPDIHIDMEKGDTVVTRGTTTGIHQGDFMGNPATGKKISYREIHIARIVGWKIVEHGWGRRPDGADAAIVGHFVLMPETVYGKQ